LLLVQSRIARPGCWAWGRHPPRRPPARTEAHPVRSQAAANPGCTFYSVKRLIGREFSAVAEDAQRARRRPHPACLPRCRTHAGSASRLHWVAALVLIQRLGSACTHAQHADWGLAVRSVFHAQHARVQELRAGPLADWHGPCMHASLNLYPACLHA